MPTDAVLPTRADVLVIGSGAGGAVTAATLAEAGREVWVLEEGPRVSTSNMDVHTPEAMRLLYRNAGLSPILGRSSIAFVEGSCVGGSTEINSAFWHRPPASAIERWQSEYGLEALSVDTMSALLDDLEATLQPTTAGEDALPASSRVFARGLRALGLPAQETPRLQLGDTTRSQFAPGAKASMSRTYLPLAEAAGAHVVADCFVRRLVIEGSRIQSVEVVFGQRTQRIEADVVFVCGGAIQTPALLRRSGIKRAVGDSLRIQPMVKVVAGFDEILDSHVSVMPVYQMRDPSTGFFLGGSVFSPGFLGMSLSERWPENAAELHDWRRMGIFYAACRGSAKGKVRVFPGTGEAIVRYAVSGEDRINLSMGMAKLCEALFAGGARRVLPGLRDAETLESRDDLRAFTGRSGPKGFPASHLGVSTVHVSSSCPMGADAQRSPVDPFGRVRGLENLHVSDASIIPDAPGVNPQGTVMALALRNARHFVTASSRSNTMPAR